jgi:hypothetical protein
MWEDMRMAATGGLIMGKPEAGSVPTQTLKTKSNDSFRMPSACAPFAG